MFCPFSLYDVVEWSCKFDVPRILAPCLAAQPLELKMYEKTRLIWFHADENGSSLVISWLLENKPDIIKVAIQSISGRHTNTVKWCIVNLLKSSPALVKWLMMKV